MSIEDYGHKVGDGYDKLVHTGLKGWVKRKPLTALQISFGAGALLGFVVGLFF